MVALWSRVLSLSILVNTKTVRTCSGNTKQLSASPAGVMWVRKDFHASRDREISLSSCPAYVHISGGDVVVDVVRIPVQSTMKICSGELHRDGSMANATLPSLLCGCKACDR